MATKPSLHGVSAGHTQMIRCTEENTASCACTREHALAVAQHVWWQASVGVEQLAVRQRRSHGGPTRTGYEPVSCLCDRRKLHSYHCRTTGRRGKVLSRLVLAWHMAGRHDSTDLTSEPSVEHRTHACRPIRNLTRTDCVSASGQTKPARVKVSAGEVVHRRGKAATAAR